jgi:ribonuclease G
VKGGDTQLTKEILVNVGERETRIAVTEDGKLVELHIEREERVVGNLYKARVENVLAGMDAAFVDIGLERNAFLYVGDVLPSVETDANGNGSSKSDNAVIEEEDEEEESDETDEERGAQETVADSGEPSSVGRRPFGRRRSIRRSVLRQQKIKDVLSVGQELLVQVIKGPRGTKGARVSTRISLPGRYLVLMPEADNIGVSRKIEDVKERDRLKKIGENLREPGYGIIIRTEAEDKTEAELRADKEFLMKLWRQIQETARKSLAPALVHQDLTLVYKTIRDVFGSDVQKLIIDDPVEYEKANELLAMVSPKLRGRIHLYTGDKPLFDEFNIENEIDRSLKRRVWLRSGGYLVFDETEALSVIDVNTGKYTGGSSLSETIVKTNLDAAAEIARQLRLRDIGGIIVIDFIDMNNPRDKQQVIRAFENALKKDRSRTKISSISALGLVEMTRKRTGETIGDFLTEPCSYCGGRGKLPSAETISIQVEREIRRAARNGKKEREALLVTCHPDVAEILIGPDGETVDRIERESQKAVYVRSDAELHLEKFEITPGDIAEFDRKLANFKRAQVVECRVARSLAQPESAVIGWTDGYMLDLNEGKKFVGQRIKARITDIRRSYATAAVIPGTNRPLDKFEVM